LFHLALRESNLCYPFPFPTLTHLAFFSPPQNRSVNVVAWKDTLRNECGPSVPSRRISFSPPGVYTNSSRFTVVLVFSNKGVIRTLLLPCPRGFFQALVPRPPFGSIGLLRLGTFFFLNPLVLTPPLFFSGTLPLFSVDFCGGVPPSSLDSTCTGYFFLLNPASSHYFPSTLFQLHVPLSLSFRTPFSFPRFAATISGRAPLPGPNKDCRASCAFPPTVTF